MAEHLAVFTFEVLATFRHDARNYIERLALELNNATYALKVGDVDRARESIADTGEELKSLARAIDSLKVLRPNPSRPAQPFTDVWDQLVCALEVRARSLGVELELQRDDDVDPLVPEPVVLALLHAATIGLSNAVRTRRARSRLLVKIHISSSNQVCVRVLFPSPVPHDDDTRLSVRLVVALLAQCDGHSSGSESDRFDELTLTLPAWETPDR